MGNRRFTMAKKPSRSGGRVTPKGTQPAGSKSASPPPARPTFGPVRLPATPGRPGAVPGGPTRSGRRGNR